MAPTGRRRHGKGEGRILQGLLVMGLAAVLGPGCAQLDTAAGGVADSLARPDAVTGKRQLNILSQEDEAELGKQIDAAILDERRKEGCGVDVDEKERARIRGLMEKIVAVSHRPDLPVTLHLIETEEFNASATVGGYVFVNRGLFQGPLAVQSDDELAAILGHEWAHVTAGHIAESISRQRVDRNIAKSALYRVSFTTENEDEADRVGILYAALAGYDPMAASRLWERAAAVSGESMRAFLYDHPLNSDRVASTRTYGAAAKPYRIPGTVNTEAKNLLNDNAVTGKTESNHGIEALLAGAAEYASQVQRTKAEVASRRAQRAEMERGFAGEPGMAEADAAFARGNASAAAKAYLQVARGNQENYLAAYGLGRCLSLLGKRDDAFVVLETSVNRGFHNHRVMRTDKALVSLRQDPRFEPLVKAAKSID